jgi:transcriptional regulator with XRE-family HTH domain
MDISAIGKKIKELRKLMGLSQKELSNGICTQAQISKIEKGEVSPYSHTLYLLAVKLGVDLNYFFEIGVTPRLDYVKEVEFQLKMARRNFQYQEIKQIVTIEENNPLFTHNNRHSRLIYWHKGIYEYHLNKDMGAAVLLFNKAISLTFNGMWKEEEIEILMSEGIVYFEEGDYPKAMGIYLQCQKHLENLPLRLDYTIDIRLLYNIARALTRMDKLSESRLYCEKGINWCVSHDQFFLLGELNYHLGYNYELEKKFEKAKFFMNRSLLIFDIQKDDKYKDYISSKVKDW